MCEERNNEKSYVRQCIRSLYDKIQEKVKLKIVDGVYEITYKDLCELLEENKYGGKQKDGQLNDWKRYMNFEKKNRKLYIYEVYDEPKEKNKYPNNALYIEHFEKILLAFLSREKGYTAYLTSGKLYEEFGMVNPRYEKIRKDVNERSKLKEELKRELNDIRILDKSIDSYINMYLERCNHKLYSITRGSLKSLDNQLVINHYRVYDCIFSTLDEYGNEVFDNIHSDEHKHGDYLTAYLDSKMRQAMDEYGYVREFDIYKKNSEEKKSFFDRFIELAQEEYPDLKGAYICHKILFNSEGAERKLRQIIDKESEDKEKQILNKQILDFINNQADDLYISTYEDTIDPRKRHSMNFLNAQHLLANKLLDTSEKYIPAEEIKENVKENIQKKIKDSTVFIGDFEECCRRYKYWNFKKVCYTGYNSALLKIDDYNYQLKCICNSKEMYEEEYEEIYIHFDLNRLKIDEATFLSHFNEVGHIIEFYVYYDCSEDTNNLIYAAYCEGFKKLMPDNERYTKIFNLLNKIKEQKKIKYDEPVINYWKEKEDKGE